MDLNWSSHRIRPSTLPWTMQALGWLRCKVAQTKAALAATPSGSYAGMNDASLTAYAAGAPNDVLSDSRATTVAMQPLRQRHPAMCMTVHACYLR